MLKILLSLLFFFTSSLATSQKSFERIQFLIGNWQGVETGMAGQGVGYRSYEFELGNNYIFLHNQSSFPPSKKKPLGEVHRDVGIFSFDGTNGDLVFRSFNIEGFTNIFILDKEASTSNNLVFVTRQIENNPGNWKGRLFIEKLNDDEFRERFEVAPDGKNYSSWLENHWYRIK